MQFSTMQQELSDRLGVYDNAIATELTRLKRWLNMAQNYICGKQNWPFLLDYEIVQTVTDITTGTVSVASGGATLTFSSGPAVSVANRYIQFSSSDDWYKITAHTAASISATISPTYGQTDALSDGTFIIRKLLYATTTPFTSYLDIKKTVNPGRLESLNQREGDFFLPLYLGTGSPWEYIMGPIDSSGYLQFSLANPPDSVFNLLVRGVKGISDMSSDSDIPPYPAKWHDATVDIAAWYGFKTVDDSRAEENLGMGEAKIADMTRVYNSDLGRHRVMAPIDTETGFGPVYTLPSNFGKMY